MKRWKLVAGVVCVFVVGVLVGAMGTGLYVKHRFARPPGIHTPGPGFLMDLYTERLDLTAEQQTRIREILGRLEAARRDYFKRTRPEIRKLRKQGVAEIKQILSPVQQEQLDTLHLELKQRRKDRKPPR